MIIWGSETKDKQIATGTFYCPSCRTRTSYSHRKVSRYFTLYFIPLFPTETYGEYLRCTSCAGQFDTRVAYMGTEQIEALVRPWECGHCGNHNPSAEPSCLACHAERGSAPPPRPARSAPAEDRRVPQA